MVKNRPFRVGVSLLKGHATRAQWHARAREVEDLGFDVLQVVDHLGMPAPFPAILAAADVTSIQLGTYVLNAAVYHPAYLARDIADTYRLVDGRLELGFGTGYVEAESVAAGVPFGTPASRVQRLRDLLSAVSEILAAEPDHPKPPVLVAAAGNKMLDLAAETADIISFPITAGFGDGHPEAVFAARVARVRDFPGELNLFVAGVGRTVADIDLSMLSHATGKTPDELAEQPGVLVGSPQQIAEKLQRFREQYGTSYISILEDHMHAFADVIPLLR